MKWKNNAKPALVARVARVASLAERDASEERQNRQGQVFYHGAEAAKTQC
jgi:hypothetical protein